VYSICSFLKGFHTIFLSRIWTFAPCVCSSDGHAERGGEEPTDIVGGVGTFGDRKKVGTYEPLHSSLIPFDHRTLDFIGLEKSENARRSIICTLAVVVVG